MLREALTTMKRFPGGLKAKLVRVARQTTCVDPYCRARGECRFRKD